jgi:hypothetical protein
MKHCFFFILSLSVISSCKKEKSCQGCSNNSPVVSTQSNHAPIANAGVDRIIALPNNSIILDASGSTDPENNITQYLWTEISGPSIFIIDNIKAAKTAIRDLVEGDYEFELKIVDADGLSDTDTVRVKVMSPQVDPFNVLFFFRDTTGGLEAENLSVIESFYPRVVLVTVKIDNYPDAEIEGFWSKKYSPWCPISSIYVDATAWGSFSLPPGIYKWTAQSVTTNLIGYPDVPSSFLRYWGAGPHRAEGTITVNHGDDCMIKEIIF